MGNAGSVPELGRSPGEGNGYPLQYSGLENSMNYIVHGVTKSQKRLTDFHSHSCPGMFFAYLGKFISRYDLLLDVILNGAVSLIFLSGSLLLERINITDFYIIIFLIYF